MCTFYRIIQFVYSRRIIVRIRLRAISETVFQFNIYRYESISLLGIAAIAGEFFENLITLSNCISQCGNYLGIN